MSNDFWFSSPLFLGPSRKRCILKSPRSHVGACLVLLLTISSLMVGTSDAQDQPTHAQAQDSPGQQDDPPAKQKRVELPEVMVRELRERDDTKTYVADDASTATRTDTPIRDVPQSIQVITRKVIEEQRTFRVNQALQNISGIISTSTAQGLFDNLLIRGFSASRSMFRNGLVDPIGFNTASDSYNIQRIEVLKGPASVLYGQGDPGGIINVVTKKPLPDAAYAGNITLGNFSFHRSEIDASGPLNVSKTLLYRFNVAGQKADSFVDFIRRDLIALSPAVTWFIGPRTTLTVEADYIKRWNRDYGGVPAQGSVLPNINGPFPRSLFTGIGDFDTDVRTAYRVGYDFTHQITSNWSVRNAFRHTIFEETDLAFAFPSALLADQRTLRRGAIGQDTVLHRHFNNMFTNLIGHLRLWDMDHTLVTGVELRQDKTDPSAFTSNQAADLDLFAPNYSPGLGALTNASFSKSDAKMAGFYVQDLIALLPNLKFLGGVRFDYIHQSANFSQRFNGPNQTSDDTGVSPRLGLVYQPIEPVSLYTSWTRGFIANSPSSFNPNGRLFDPERSTQYEIGMKTFFLQNRISTTLAWYHLTRENLLTPDPIIPGFQVQTGEQRSQGIELDVTTSLTPSWNVIASYGYTDAEVTVDNNPALIHKRLGNVPYNKATVWSTYHFQEGPLKGFGFGGGVYGFTARNASIFGSQLKVPGYVRLDAAVYYNRALQPGNWLSAKAVNVAVNVRNVLDHPYIEQALNSTTRLLFGEPLTVLATVGIKF